MNRLRELRRARGLTQEDVAQTIGVQKAAICKYETGRVSIPPDTLMVLCDLFGVSADYMLCRDQAPFHPLFEPHTAPGRLFKPALNAVVGVPLLGRVHAGLPMLADENISEYIPMPAADVQAGEYFYMEVEGDCMVGACIPEGALVLVRLQNRVENGQIAVVRLEDEVLLRKVKWAGGQLVLIPANARYEPLVVAGGDVQIMGRVVEARIRGL